MVDHSLNKINWLAFDAQYKIVTFFTHYLLALALTLALMSTGLGLENVGKNSSLVCIGH